MSVTKCLFQKNILQSKNVSIPVTKRFNKTNFSLVLYCTGTNPATYKGTDFHVVDAFLVKNIVPKPEIALLQISINQAVVIH
jgi:hypothetical protein